MSDVSKTAAPSFNVEDFRRPGDSDEEALQRAVEAAKAAGGGNVIFGSRTYDLRA
jgi:polygalacturonase